MRFAPLACALAALLLLGSAGPAWSNGEVHETEYSTSLSEAAGAVRLLVAGFGGVIAILGIVLAVRGAMGSADVSASVGGGSVEFKRVSQGVVVTIVGAAVLLGAVYLLPDKRTERKVTGKDITIEHEEGHETLHTAE